MPTTKVRVHHRCRNPAKGEAPSKVGAVGSRVRLAAIEVLVQVWPYLTSRRVSRFDLHWLNSIPASSTWIYFSIGLALLFLRHPVSHPFRAGPRCPLMSSLKVSLLLLWSFVRCWVNRRTLDTRTSHIWSCQVKHVWLVKFLGGFLHEHWGCWACICNV